jgi:hypothetical protein
LNSDGAYSLQAIARDPAGNKTTSPSINLTVKNAVNNNLVAGLAAYWKCDDGKGIQLIDSQAALVGTLQTGASWSTGVFDGAVSFDGLTGFIEVPDTQSLHISGNLSLACWVKQSSLPASPALMYYLEKGLDDHDNYAMGVQASSGGLKLFFEFEDPSGINHHYLQSGTVGLTVGQWTHVALVFDDTANTVRFFKDGSQVGSVPVTESLNGSVTAPLQIGRENFAGYEWPYSGSLDDLRIYNRALTASEVAALAQSHPPQAPLGLTLIQ